jgi:hypothetical protein
MDIPQHGCGTRPIIICAALQLRRDELHCSWDRLAVHNATTTTTPPPRARLAGALAPIDRHMTAAESRTHQRAF